MNDLPSMWRTELFHPQGVHFPIALLTIGVIFYMFSFLKNKHFTFLKPASIALIGLGTITSWIAVFTGDLAYDIIIRDLCDPTMVKDHEVNAFTTAFIFSGGFIIQLFSQIKNIRLKWKKLINTLIAIIFVTGLSFLLYTGHLGASIVYQQAGAVYVPAEDCSEFD